MEYFVCRLLLSPWNVVETPQSDICLLGLPVGLRSGHPPFRIICGTALRSAFMGFTKGEHVVEIHPAWHCSSM